MNNIGGVYLNTFEPQTVEQAEALKKYIENNFNHDITTLSFIKGLLRGRKVRNITRDNTYEVIEVQIKGFIISTGKKLEYVSYTNASDWKLEPYA